MNFTKYFFSDRVDSSIPKMWMGMHWQLTRTTPNTYEERMKIKP